MVKLTKPSNGNRLCPYCDYRTSKQSTLSMHIAMKHDNERRPHCCPYCSLTFRVRTQLHHHVTNHHVQPWIKCEDPDCSLTFKNPTTAKVHYVRKHLDHKTLFKSVLPPQDDLVQCLSCSKVCKRPSIFYHLAQCSLDSPFSRLLVDSNDNREDDVRKTTFATVCTEETESDAETSAETCDEEPCTQDCSQDLVFSNTTITTEMELELQMEMEKEMETTSTVQTDVVSSTGSEIREDSECFFDNIFAGFETLGDFEDCEVFCTECSFGNEIAVND